MRREWLPLHEAARFLHVDRSQLELLISSGWLPRPERGGLLPIGAVEALADVLMRLEAGRLDLDELDRPPPYLTPAQAITWLGIDEVGLRIMIREGRLVLVPMFEVGDQDLLKVLLAAEAMASDETWTDRAALLLDTVEWWVNRMRKRLMPRQRREIAEVLGTEVVLRTEDVRKLARRRGRFNPPRGAARPRRRCRRP